MLEILLGALITTLALYLSFLKTQVRDSLTLIDLKLTGVYKLMGNLSDKVTNIENIVGNIETAVKNETDQVGPLVQEIKDLKKAVLSYEDRDQIANRLETLSARLEKVQSNIGAIFTPEASEQSQATDSATTGATVQPGETVASETETEPQVPVVDQTEPFQPDATAEAFEKVQDAQATGVDAVNGEGEAFNTNDLDNAVLKDAQTGEVIDTSGAEPNSIPGKVVTSDVEPGEGVQLGEGHYFSGSVELDSDKKEE